MACVLVSWDTGFVSFEKEHSRAPDGHNLIDVVQHAYGGDLDEALARALALRDRIMALFLRLREALLARGEPLLNRYVATLERLVRGGVDWTLGSARYRPQADEVRPAVVVHAAGAADRLDDWPGQSAAAAPGIASVDWWWRYDPARC